MKPKKTYIVAYIVFGLTIWTLISVITSKVVLELSQYLGITLGIISVVLLFVNQRLFKYVFTLTLIVNAAGLIYFTPYIISSYTGINHTHSNTNISVSFNPLGTFLLFIHILLNWKGINEKLKTKEPTEEEKRQLYISQVESWKNKYSNKPTKELENIKNQEGILEVARQAASELLKQKTQHNT